MTIRNVYYEITSFHTLMVADTHVSKGKRENTERLRFYDNREGNLEEISTLLRAGKVPKVEYHSFYVYVPKVPDVHRTYLCVRKGTRAAGSHGTALYLDARNQDVRN